MVVYEVFSPVDGSHVFTTRYKIVAQIVTEISIWCECNLPGDYVLDYTPNIVLE